MMGICLAKSLCVVRWLILVAGVGGVPLVVLGRDIRINEVDADQAGSDNAEFIELYDGGVGNTPLDGLVVVLFNGGSDASYLAIDLDGYSTDADGLFVIGNPGVPNVSLVMEPGSGGAVQNGADAVALFTGNADDFPDGTPVTSDGLVDALVYGTDDPEAFSLLDVLTPGQEQVNDTAAESMARVPDGGAARETSTYRNQAPTPGLRNKADAGLNLGIVLAPAVLSESSAVPATATLTRTGPLDVVATVFIAASDATEVRVDTSAVFGIGESTITVNIEPVDDLWADGAQTVTVSVREGNNALNPAEAALVIEDDGDENALVVNEVYPAVDTFSGDANRDGEILEGFDEFVEIVNASATVHDLSGYTLSDAVVVRHTFPQGTLLDPGCALVVFGGGTVAEGLLQEFGNALVQKANGANEFGLGLNNAGDIVSIRNRDGLEVAGAAWDAVSARDGSLTRFPDITGAFDFHATVGFAAFGPGHDVNGDPFCKNAPTLTLTFSPSVIAEDAGPGAALLTVSSSGPVAEALVVELANDDPTEVSIPARVTIPAGQSSVEVFIDAVDDAVDDGTQWVGITASAPGYILGRAEIAVSDDGDAPAAIVINEFDADQEGADTREFIELYDGGVGNLPLDGLVVVLFNGSTDASYAAIDLNGQSTDASGFLVLGSAEVPGVQLVVGGFQLQNGPDAIAIYRGTADAFPDGTPATGDALVDAVVYGTDDPAATGLLEVLTPGQPQLNEGSGNNGNAVGRLPDGGAPFLIGAYVARPPSPGRSNAVTGTLQAVVVPPAVVENGDAIVMLTISRTGPTDSAVDVTIAIDDPSELTGPASATIASGQGSTVVQLAPVDDAWPDGDRLVTIGISAPDGTLGATSVAVTVIDDGADTQRIVINELDPDQEGTDAAEFIELYDGGVGNVPLDGLIVVLFNGTTGQSYMTIDLGGRSTGNDGFFVIGSAALAATDLAFSPATNALQNAGDAVDAVAIYRGTADRFPDGSTPVPDGLIDAVVYGSATAADDSGLLDLLTPGSGPADEDPGRKSNALARVPDGGAAFDTSTYRRQAPTPGRGNGEGGVTGFDLWALGYPGIGGPAGDADLDGIDNALEYALGLNPASGDVHALPAPAIDAGGRLTLTVAKGDIAGTDPRLRYVVEVSSNLIDWATEGTATLTDTASELVVTSTGPATSLFMRLRIELAP